MLSTELPTAAWLVTLAISIVSFIAAYGSFHFCLRVSRKERDLRYILMLLTQLEDAHEALSASHKRLRSRIGMQELRARKKSAQNGSGEPAEPEVDHERAAWKREMRLKLHRGELKP